MNLVAQAKERLPRPVRATLRPVYQKVRGVWNPAVVLDKELLRDTEEIQGGGIEMASTEIQYPRVRPGTLERWHALKHILRSKIKDGQVVLDVGGYDGFIAYQLTKIFPNLKATVVDLDYSGLKLAKKGLNCLLGSADALPIRDNSVDTVLCLALIQCMENDTGLIKEISRVLNENGKVFLTTPFRNKSLIPFLDMTMINKRWGHVRNGYEFTEIKNLFDSNSLYICTRGKYQNIFSRYAYYLANLSRIPLRGKGRLYRAVIRLEPLIKLGAREHIIVGRKSIQASYNEKGNPTEPGGQQKREGAAV